MSEKLIIVGDDYLRFEDVVLRELNAEGQYVSRFVDGSLGCPNLGDGLRFSGETAQWSRLRIHKDDVAEFVQRYRDYNKKKIEELIRGLRGSGILDDLIKEEETP